jgi:hypothetical protein
MFAVFQFFHLIQHAIFQTTESLGPFILPHAVCAVIVTMFVSAIFATDHILKSDDQILNIVDPPNHSDLRTPSSPEPKPRQQHRTPKNTYKPHIIHFQQTSTPINPLKTCLSTKNPRIQSTARRRSIFFQLHNPWSSNPTAPVMTRRILPTTKIKIKAPNPYCPILQLSSDLSSNLFAHLRSTSRSPVHIYPFEFPTS